MLLYFLIGWLINDVVYMLVNLFSDCFFFVYVFALFYCQHAIYIDCVSTPIPPIEQWMQFSQKWIQLIDQEITFKI
jgi:hypothetical protein